MEANLKPHKWIYSKGSGGTENVSKEGSSKESMSTSASARVQFSSSNLGALCCTMGRITNKFDIIMKKKIRNQVFSAKKNLVKSQFTAKRKLERLQFSTSSSFVKIWSACSCEFKAYFWTFWALYHLLFDLETIGVN